MNEKVVTIVIDLSDRASGQSLNNLKKSLADITKRAEQTRSKLAALGYRNYRIGISLLDKISQPGSKIYAMLRAMVSKSYQISMRLNDNIFGRVKSLESTILRLAGKTYAIGFRLKDDLRSQLKSLSDGLLTGAGAMGGMLGGFGAGYAITGALESYAGFERAMSKVAAIRQLDKNSAEMQALTEQAKMLGATTQFTRQQSAEGQFYLGLAGYDTQSILKAMPHVLNLAAASDLDLGRASDIVSDTATAFGISPTETYMNKQGKIVNTLEGYIDMLTKIQAISNTDVSQAYEALKYAGPVLGAIGRGKSTEFRMQVAEDALTAVGLMADSGIKSSQSGTALRAVFSRFSGENRNALFGLRTLGVEVQRNGEMLTPGEIIKNLKQRVDEGIPAEHLTEILEIFSQEKIHADTKRKLDSFIADAMANGGKIGSAGLMKMSAMLAGQEAMSGLLAMLSGDWDKKAAEMDKATGSARQMAETLNDNLTGSFIRLESAYDAFRQGFFEGGAGDGIRAFVDSLTELTSRATKLFSDGIDIPDLGRLIADVVDRLKNKFVQLDDVGSILAGGTLMAGLVKIGSTVQKVIGYFRSMKGFLAGQMLGGATGTTGAGAKGGTVSSMSQVGTANITAGVVNVNGKVGGVGGAGGTSAGSSSRAAAGVATSPIIAAQNNLAQATAARDKALAAAWASPGTRYLQQNLRREEQNVLRARQALIQERTLAYNQQIADSKAQIAASRSQQAAMRSTFMGGARGGAAFAGLFAALDVFNSKSISAERAKEAADALNVAKAEYQELVRQSRPAEELAQHAADIQRLQGEQNQILQANQARERETLAGATGSVLGAAIGAGLGSIAGPLGMSIGGVIGGVLGDFLGKKAADIDTGETSKRDFFTQGGSEVQERTQAQSAKQIAAANYREVIEESKMLAAVHARRATGGSSGGNINQEIVSKHLANMESRVETIRSKIHAMRETHDQRTRFNLYDDYLKRQGSALQFGGNQSLAQDFYRQQAEMLANTLPAQVIANQQRGWDLLRDLIGFGGTAHAATLSEEQLLQQTQMETPARSRTIGEAIAEKTATGTTAAEVTQPEMGMFDTSTLEQWQSDIESFIEGMNETFTGLGESINQSMTTAFEGVGEVFTGFSESITENLTSAFEGISEYFSEIGATFGENLSASLESTGEIFSGFGDMVMEHLTVAFESASEMFTGFGEMVTTSMTSAQASAETSLVAIGTTFETTKSNIQSSWTELPGFFEGVFSGLGGAASSAGAAIHAGLTAPIGSIIAAWQGAASQISSIISSISAQASAMPSVTIGGTGAAYASGGFVTSPVQALIGEAGAEVVIPLSASKRSRAIDLFEKTGAILGQGAAIPMSDFESPALTDAFGDSNFTVDAPTPVTSNITSGDGAKIEISLGGINGTTFSITGAGNPQEVVNAIKENLSEVADKIAGQLGKTVLASYNNMSLGH